MNLRKAAEMALEAWSDPQGMPKLCKAFDALREALAQPEQEPYAYTAEGECWWNRFTNYALAAAHLDSLRIPEERRLYLYLHPAPIAEGACWQPIETAPKNGRGFLAYEKGKRPFVALWLYAEHPDVDEDGWYEHWSFDPVEPTHWMPLPAAPKPEE